MGTRSRTTGRVCSIQVSVDSDELQTIRRHNEPLGYHRISSTRAASTNDPIALVKTNIARNADARRWCDLMLSYRERLGDRSNEETVRVRVLALVNLTLELERLTDGLVAGQQAKLLRKSDYDRQGRPQTLVYERGDPHLLMHLTGQIQTLLKSLGLEKDAPYREETGQQGLMVQNSSDSARQVFEHGSKCSVTNPSRPFLTYIHQTL
jgi:hypothetical protein